MKSDSPPFIRSQEDEPSAKEVGSLRFETITIVTDQIRADELDAG